MGKKSKKDWGPGHSLNDDPTNEATIPSTIRNLQEQGTAAIPHARGPPSEAAIKAREAALARIEAQRQRKVPQKGGIIDRQIAAQQLEEQRNAILQPKHDEVVAPEEGIGAGEPTEDDSIIRDDNYYGGRDDNARFPQNNGSGDGSNGSGGEHDDHDNSLLLNVNALQTKIKSVSLIMQKQLYKFIIGRLDLGSYSKDFNMEFNYNCQSPEECHQEDLRRIAAIDHSLGELTKAGTLDVTNNPHFEDMDYLLLKILFPDFTTLYICMRKEDKLNYLIRHLRDILIYDLPFVLEIPVSPLRKEIKSEDNNSEAFRYHGLFPCGLIHLKYDSEIQDQIEAANEGKKFEYVKQNI
uniref:Phosducin domain-containing protein n=1 Tax=Strongyloides venezuelensis TaxID=75913 RepID=A0A0K0G4W5_STRVS